MSYFGRTTFYFTKTSFTIMFVIGDKIRLRYTGMRAEIVEDHLDGSYTILDDEDEETIAFVEDIVLADHFEHIEVSEVQKSVKKKTKTPKLQKLSTEEMFFSKSQLEQKFHSTTSPTLSSKKGVEKETAFKFPTIHPTKPTDKGCFLVFLPISATDYSIYLVNDTAASFGFEFRMFLQQEVVHGLDKVIPAYDFFAIGEFKQPQFNDAPLMALSFPRLQFEKKIKLKFKKFNRSYQVIPLMGLESYAYSVFETFPPKANATGMLQDYTANHHGNKAFVLRPVNRYYKRLNLMEHASFDVELDLHAENLVNDTSEFLPGELFSLQIEVLEKFIQKALSLDIKEVYIIHGIGSGKLKDGVSKHLRFRDGVKDYQNSFHNKYGFGATVVKLR